jgi:hypothetical protein
MNDETQTTPTTPAGAASALSAGLGNTAAMTLERGGVFKGAHGLEGLANAVEFWEQQPYGTRLYYGDGIADYLHRDVLRAAVDVLRAAVKLLASMPNASVSGAASPRPIDAELGGITEDEQ